MRTTFFMHVFFQYNCNQSFGMKVLKTKNEVAIYIDAILSQNKTVGFVPTMGALHKGHLQLVSQAKAENDIAIASIFVNPTQFNNPEDLKKYPRMPLLDIDLLKEVACDAVFIPEVSEMYAPDETGLNFDIGNLAQVMEGEFRPGHFQGVITIVHKLFDIVKPTAVYLGEKDFQQLAVIRFMAAELHPKIKIVGSPTVREDDGLAMSSRNLRLTTEERNTVSIIYKSLQNAIKWKSQFSVTEVKDKVMDQINNTYPLKVEYFDIVDSTTLQSIINWSDSDNPRACIAVLTSTVRLIDNIAL